MTEIEVESKFAVLRSVGEECVTEDGLRELLKKKPNFRAYDGFEPSGRMHIAQGLLRAININKCTESGGTFVLWVADWFGLMNNKLGGDLDKIRITGKYFIEVWKGAGVDMKNVEVLWSSEEINRRPQEYWRQVLDIARQFSLWRITKCCTAMGRKDSNLTASTILYPLMQCADIFFLKADICQLGVDQRKVNMLAREYCDAIGRKLKPVILSHHMLYGLVKGQSKMSKSNPDSAIFMEDSPEEVRRKIENAYCPFEVESSGHAEDDGMHLEKDELKNPILDYVRYIIFSRNGTFEAGGKTYHRWEEVRSDFIDKTLSEKDLKDGVIDAVNKLLDPIRTHFRDNAEARELLEIIRSQYKVLSEKQSVEEVTPEPRVIYTIFAPLPSISQVPLASVCAVLRQLHAVPQGATALLWLRDWSAFVCNCLNGEDAAIKAAYVVLVETLNILAPEVMKNVQVVWQSEHILKDPNDYWITAIKEGKDIPVEIMRTVIGQNSEQQPSSDIIYPLMHISDVKTSRVTHIITPPEEEPLHRFVNDVAKAQVEIIPVVFQLPPLKDQAHPGDLDSFISVLNSEMDVNSKIKKSFCEPGNVAFCPPLALVKEIIMPLAGGVFRLERNEESGGTKEYTDFSVLESEYAQSSVHPKDLKTNISRYLKDILNPVREHFKSNAAAKKAVTDLTNFEKKKSKKQQH